MSKCKHEIWDWKLIPGQVNTDYKAVYCELCDEQLTQVGSPDKNGAKPKQWTNPMGQTLNTYIITFTDNGEQVEVNANSLIDLTPLIQQFNRQGRGCKITRAVETKTVVEPTKPKAKEKTLEPKPMTDKQVAYIRVLFAQVKTNMTIDEQESLTTKMKAHIDGTNVLTTKWASAAIEKLKTYKKGM